MGQQDMFANARNFGINGGNFTNIGNQTKVIASQNGLDLLLRCSAMSARLDSSERIDPGRCNPATRVAVIKEIIDWIESDNPASSMMRILGAAGAGKTALAQSIGELCMERGWLAASFFVSRTAPGRNNGFTIIPTIAYQLASSYPEARSFIRNRVESDPSLLDQSIQTIMEKLIIDPLSSWWCKGSGVLKSFVNVVQPRLIVIDGLDECDEPNIQCEILRVIAMATQQLHQHSIRFLITSRPESHILHTFKREPVFRSIDLITIDLENLRDAEHDIKIFLTHGFEGIKETHVLSAHLPDAWPGTGAISALAKKASGQFIYASVVMKYVASNKHDPRYRLEVVLGNSLQPTHDTPFSHLDALYSHIFSTVNTSNIPLIRRILGFMVIPRTDGDGFGEYTSPKMLETLLSLAKGSVYIILADLRSLISMDGGYSEPMKFFHASLSDFLLDSSRSGKFLVNLRMAHETLTKEYLRLIRAQVNNPLVSAAELGEFLTTSLHHYKACISSGLRSESLQEALRNLDFFFVQKHVHPPTVTGADGQTLNSLREAWRAGQVQTFFHVLEDTHADMEPHLNSLYRNYNVDPTVLSSLQSFFEGGKSSEYVCQHCNCVRAEGPILRLALHVPLLHHFLDGPNSASSVAERCADGVYQCLRYLGARRMVLERHRGMVVIRRSKREWEAWEQLKNARHEEFSVACVTCASILLRHAAYSHLLVSLLVRQITDYAIQYPLFDLESSFIPYLQRFEAVIDQPLALKLRDAGWLGSTASHDTQGSISIPVSP